MKQQFQPSCMNVRGHIRCWGFFSSEGCQTLIYSHPLSEMSTSYFSSSSCGHKSNAPLVVHIPPCLCLVTGWLARMYKCVSDKIFLHLSLVGCVTVCGCLCVCSWLGSSVTLDMTASQSSLKNHWNVEINTDRQTHTQRHTYSDISPVQQDQHPVLWDQNSNL